jgi:copper chaperone CopZ
MKQEQLDTLGPEGTQRLELAVDGMSCGACAERIRLALAALPGVEGVEVEIGRVRLDYYPEAVGPQSLRACIESLGYQLPSTAPPSRNPLRRFLERMGQANDKALEGKRLDCCKIVEK